MWEFIRDLTAAIAVIVGAVLMILSRIPRRTIDEQEKLIKALEGRISDLEKSHIQDQNNHLESVKAIADLQGQIKVYKELPLTDIATAMKDMNIANKEIAKNNKLILQTLRHSAAIAAGDRGFVTPNQTIEEQTVVHQIVESKE